jgi:hypothetical protein
MKRLVPVLLFAGLCACASVPEEALSSADVGRLCARLAEEPGLLERGALGHRILKAGGAPSGCRDAAYGAATASDHYRFVDAYQTVRLVQ